MNRELTSMQENFLHQTLNDSWSDYEVSLCEDASNIWDWIVITASNERQAKVYQYEIDCRLAEHRIPNTSRYLIVPDRDGQRIGSGGASLNALVQIAEKIGLDKVSSQKILMLHSGGDSKRIPQYSVKGKLFTPTPHELPNGCRSTIFDDLLVAVAGIPGRIQSGVLMLPSDTVLVFNPLQLDLPSEAAGISMKAPVLEGTEHGVFLEGKAGEVSAFMHKLPESELYSLGAVDEHGQVDIDTGCVWFGKSILEALVGLISAGGLLDQKKVDFYVNKEACLSLYADFLYPLAADSTLENYLKEAPENVFNDQLIACRYALWNALHSHSLKLVRLIPSRYIHFGTTWELRELLTKNIDSYPYLGWKRKVDSFCATSTKAILNNAYIEEGAFVSDTAYIENARISGNVGVGNGSIVSHASVEDCFIPDQVVIHGIQTQQGTWVCRIFGVEDNPKESSGAPFLCSTLDTIISNVGIDPSEVWDSSPASIWNAKLYPVCKTEQEALRSALVLYRISQGSATKEEIAHWRDAEKESLHSSFNSADSYMMAQYESDIEDEIKVASFVSSLEQGISSVELVETLHTSIHFETRLKKIYEKAEKADFPLNMRIYLALADILRRQNKSDTKIYEKSASDLEQCAYDVVREGIVSSLRGHNPLSKIKGSLIKSSVSVELPVRVNFCGSPSDAAPYCIEHGGTMLDAAVLLKGKLPVHAEINRIEKPVVLFASRDQDVVQEYSSLEALFDCENPYDAFALHKACLLASGVLNNVKTFDEFIVLCEGGIELITDVDVPKGSGLGTSSILAAACLTAIDNAFGVEPTCDLIYEQVFVAEQLMGTCGGWQDQVGGLTPGIKYFTSDPGMCQTIDVEFLALSDQTKKELQERFVLIFSGQRRLARNVLRQETNQLIRNDTAALKAIDRIQELSTLMRYYLLRGKITSFAQCMTEQLSHIKVLDSGATNTCIDYIFQICDDLIDGKSVCGAGGGGFLQAILKTNVTKEMLVQRIEEEFHGCGVEVWDAALYFADDPEKGIS